MSGLTPDTNSENELREVLVKMCHLVSLQEEDIASPSEGAFILGQTGVSVLWNSRPSACWQIREKYDVIDASGDRFPVSRLIASVPEIEVIRVAKIAYILVFERSLDIEISML